MMRKRKMDFKIMEGRLLKYLETRDFCRLLRASKRFVPSKTTVLCLQYGKTCITSQQRKEAKILCEMLSHLELQSIEKERLRMTISTLRSRISRMASEKEELLATNRENSKRLRRLLTRAAESASEWRHRYIRMQN